jgi:hypothetical protein
MPKKKAAVPKPEPETCPHCGEVRDAEELGLQKTWGPLVCPKCEREGCFECMPMGRGCKCPECEDGEDQE